MSDEIQVELPDGSQLSVEDGATVEDVAYTIGEGLGNDTVAGKVNGELVAKEHTVKDGDQIEIVTADSDEYVDVLRHTAAHVFAQALQRVFPEAKLTLGPWTDNGFYYDIDNVDLNKEDLEEIEEEAENIIAEDLSVERIELPRSKAQAFYADNKFKREILDEEASDGARLSFYKQGEFKDLCKGPHVESTGKIGGFTLLEIAGAYWRGDEDNKMLTRVYGTAFPTEQELEDFLEKRREAEKRDHRKIGHEMDLFSVQDVTGPGLPLYHPNGKTILNELRGFINELNKRRGCKPVETPHLFKTDLWKKSGHYENYRDDMFLFEVGGDELGLKPMNCPGHCMIFDKHVFSYRDMPVRYVEQGKVYRKEQRGELSGLSRVWAFTIDDGHIFARPDQIQDEATAILENIIELLDAFGLDYDIFLATQPEKYVGSDEIWEKAETQLKNVMEEKNLAYDMEDGDGAFYGPKIDFALYDAIGREHDGPTIQLDFNMPDRFNLTYTGEDGEEKTPVMIHRALYGSYERFFMALIEHFAGNFPTWLAPEQVRVIPITDDNLEYARAVAEELDEFRVTVDEKNATVGKKIRKAHEARVPYMLLVGDDEEENQTVAVRDRFENEKRNTTLNEFTQHLREEVAEKTLEPNFLHD